MSKWIFWLKTSRKHSLWSWLGKANVLLMNANLPDKWNCLRAMPYFLTDIVATMYSRNNVSQQRSDSLSTESNGAALFVMAAGFKPNLQTKFADTLTLNYGCALANTPVTNSRLSYAVTSLNRSVPDCTMYVSYCTCLQCTQWCQKY